MEEVKLVWAGLGGVWYGGYGHEGLRAHSRLEFGICCFTNGVFSFCRFLDEVQAHSDVNKMSVQNLATVFGPNILRPQIEDPVTIMEGKREVTWRCPKLRDLDLC